MSSYDPAVSPDAQQWLALDEGERIEQVSSYHQRNHLRLPDAQLHAVVHVVIENQLALGEAVVAERVGRLQEEGLSRHEAVHAIGSVLAEDLYALMQEETGPADAIYQRYLTRVRALTVSGWRAQRSEP